MSENGKGFMPKNGNGNGNGKSNGNGHANGNGSFVPVALEGNGASSESRQPVVADGVSRFVESLIKKNIVSTKTVRDAVEWKKTRGDGEKRLLYQILIEQFEADREEVYKEFVR